MWLVQEKLNLECTDAIDSMLLNAIDSMLRP